MQHRTRIKFCGICRVEDAVAAARLGADAIGMVFHPPAGRNVPMERARQILAALPPFVTPVALFVDADTRLILEITEELRIRHVQLNGHETPQHVAELRRLTVIKAIRVQKDRFAEELSPWRLSTGTYDLDHLRGIVLETGGTGQAGGTGIENDWQTIRRHMDAGHFQDLPPLIAAGGLTPENVGGVVMTLRPWAVDVSSGIESVRGQKSEERMIAFIRAVRGADE